MRPLPIQRRQFLKTAGIAPLAVLLGNLSAAPDLDACFEASSHEVMALARRVMEKCVLEKIMPPTPPLKHTWIVPGGPYYVGQWIWDTMFVVDLLSILPDREKMIRDIFQNYWDFQDRWNKTAPEYARDMITVAIKTEPQEADRKKGSSMRQHMWDDKAGTFLSVKRDTLAKIPVATIGGWIPLAAGVPTAAQAQRMAEVLASPAWQTPLPLPTVDRTDKRWKPDAFWRGDVWPSTNYQIATGLAAFGHQALAADIADKTVANSIKNGIAEHYDSVTGKALGVSDYCMSCTVVTMMLDGLTRKHLLHLRSAP